jgi:hypothetical protein
MDRTEQHDQQQQPPPPAAVIEDLSDRQESTQPTPQQDASVKGGIVVIDKVSMGDGSVRSVSTTDASMLSTLQHTGGVNY